MMRCCLSFLVAVLVLSLNVASMAAADATKKVVLIAGPKSHGPVGNGIHDYPWSVKLLKVMLNHSNIREQVRVEYHLDGMPRDLKTLDDADTIMVISDGRDGDLYQEAPHFGSEENLQAVQKQIDRGCGFLTFHFSTFAPDKYAQQILDWSGGYFDWETDGKKQWYSAIKTLDSDVQLATPDHPVLRGVKPFKMKEEFYFNLRFPEPNSSLASRPSPLFTVPALNGREPDGNIVAWAKQRANGGRGFGTTCGHFYANWEHEQFRRTILNAIAWTAKVEIPAGGAESRYFTHAEITSALAGIQGTQRSVLDDKPIRVLLLAGNDAHKWHNWEKTTPAIKAALEEDPRIKVDVTLDIEELAKRNLAKSYDLVIPNYVNWHDPKPLSDASKAAFMNFVQNGGGVLFIHFSPSAFHFSLPMGGESDWPEYRKIALRVWNHHGKGEAQSGHDAFGPFDVAISPLEHPITAGLKNFGVMDELYFKQDGRAVEPLITAKSKVTQREEPLAFVGSYGKGRVFQTLLGHSEKTYDVFEPREMLRRAAAWTTNRRVVKLEVDGFRAKVESPKPAPVLNPQPKPLSLVPGKFGQALDARATGVLIDAKPEQRSVPLTVECWAKLESKAGFNILVASETKSSATHWELYSYASGGFFSVFLPSCGGEYRSATVIADGQWHHVAMVLEAKRIRMFVDGKSAVDQALPHEFGSSKAGALAIGRLVEGGIGCDGLIDEVHIRRGAAAIEGLPDKASVVGENTVGLWRFDELLDKTKLKDESKSQTPATADARPSTLNAQPATKAKDRSHWGKSQVGFEGWEDDWIDKRWPESNIGRWLSSVVALPGGAGRKMTSIRIGDQQQATLCFDAQTAQVRAIWTGGFLKFNPARFGIIGAPTPDGPFYFHANEGSGWPGSKVQYRGLHTHGERVVLSYLVDGVPVLESPWCEMLQGEIVVTRAMEIGPSDNPLDIAAFESTKRIDSQLVGDPWLMQEQGPAGRFLGVKGWPEVQPRFTSDDNGIRATWQVPPHKETRRLKLVYWVGHAGDKATWQKRFAEIPAPKPSEVASLETLAQPGPARWTEKIETVGKRAADDAAYVVDTFTLPFDNPYKALLFTSGHDFLSNGDIVVCTVHGDVWRVRAEGRGARGEDMKLRWQRIATGLHQPLGLVVKRPDATSPLAPHPSPLDEVYVLGRDQITRLHDRNGDGETDYYECFSNVYPTSAGGHDYITCLERDSAGNFWFVHANQGIVKVSADGQKFEVVATGLRNPNGMGLGPGDVVTAAPQEGEWTPASAIYVSKPGAHFGGGGPRVTDSRPLGYDPPAVWIPRRVDNSSGGQAWVTSDKWGPLAGHMLHFSFGQCSMMLGIRSHAHQSVGEASENPRSGERGYGLPTGLTEFPFRFDSGAMRGRFSPHDGQLYVTGLRGWTSAASVDGCLQRVRYTGQPVDLPVATAAYSNGIAITFTEPLDKNSAEQTGSYHLEQWNYKYSQAYGSPEYRVSDPKQEGRDEVRVRSATLLDNRTVFLEIKDLKPVNVLAISLLMKSAGGRDIRRTLYSTINVVRSEKFDESKLNRHSKPGSLDESQEAGLRPGLLTRIWSEKNGSAEADDVRQDRLAAFFVAANHAPSTLLKPGPFRLQQEGYLRVPLQQTVRFSVEGRGTVKLVVNDEPALSIPAITPEAATLSPPVILRGGFNKLFIEYSSPARGEHSQMRLLWESADFAREPILSTALFHNGDDETLLSREQLRRGRELFASHHCRTCHGPAHDKDQSNLADVSNAAPRLGGYGRNASWVIEWLLDPTRFDPGSRMPQLLNGDDQQAREEAKALAAVMMGTELLSTPEQGRGQDGHTDDEVKFGAVLFEDLSCIGCHRFTPTNKPDEHGRRSLSHLNAKYPTGALNDFLRDPQRRNPHSSMPNFRLNSTELRGLVGFLKKNGGDPLPEVDWRKLDDELKTIVKDKQIGELFKSRGCVRCHSLNDAPPEPLAQPIPLTDLRSAQGCLSEQRHRRSGVPWYRLSPADRAALIRFVETDRTSLDQHAPIEESRRLTKTLGCAACHDRDGLNSPRRAIIGDESARGVPPDLFPNLTWAGEKLRAGWISQFLKTPAVDQSFNFSLKAASSAPEREASLKTLRPWIKGRMPTFKHHADAIAEGLAAEHGVPFEESVSLSLDPRKAEHGEALVQRTALDCRQCHAVGSQVAQGDDKTKLAPGINFAHTRERIRLDFYRRFTLDPPRYDITTRMPKLAADGKTTKVTNILNGDARQQFEAIWHYLQSVAETKHP